MSPPERATMVLAAVFDRKLDRAIGRTARALLAERPLPNSDYKRLAAMDVEDRPEGLFIRYKSNQLWLAFGWAWFTLATAVVIVVLLGNSWFQPGPVRTSVFAAVTAVAANFVGNMAVCFATGSGRSILGRPGGGTLLWVLATAASWLYLLVVIL